MAHLIRFALLLALAGVLDTRIVAQAPTAKSDVAPFLGAWTLTLNTPQGQTPLTLSVKSDNQTVTGEIGSDVVPVQSITDISTANGAMVLRYMRDIGGNPVPVKVTLKPVDGRMRFEFDMASGQIVLDGDAVKRHE